MHFSNNNYICISLYNLEWLSQIMPDSPTIDGLFHHCLFFNLLLRKQVNKKHSIRIQYEYKHLLSDIKIMSIFFPGFSLSCLLKKELPHSKKTTNQEIHPTIHLHLWWTNRSNPHFHLKGELPWKTATTHGIAVIGQDVDFWWRPSPRNPGVNQQRLAQQQSVHLYSWWLSEPTHLKNYEWTSNWIIFFQIGMKIQYLKSPHSHDDTMILFKLMFKLSRFFYKNDPCCWKHYWNHEGFSKGSKWKVNGSFRMNDKLLFDRRWVWPPPPPPRKKNDEFAASTIFLTSFQQVPSLKLT